MKYLISAMIMTIWASGSLAHSPLSATTPADGAVLTQPPTELILEFNGEMRLTRVSLSVTGASAVHLDLSEQTSFANRFTLPLTETDLGSYEIEWRGLGSDGHVQSGTFLFTVE